MFRAGGRLLFGAEDVRERGMNDGFVEGGRILVLFKYLLCSLQALMEVLPFAARSMNAVHKTGYY